jgi:hypothetical protein
MLRLALSALIFSLFAPAHAGQRAVKKGSESFRPAAKGAQSSKTAAQVSKSSGGKRAVGARHSSRRRVEGDTESQESPAVNGAMVRSNYQTVVLPSDIKPMAEVDGGKDSIKRDPNTEQRVDQGASAWRGAKDTPPGQNVGSGNASGNTGISVRTDQ